MMGQQERTESLFYYFRLEDQIPPDHLLRLIDKHVDLSLVRERPKPFYSSTGRPSIDPEVLRLLLIGYLYGVTSERRLLEEVKMHLAYRWFTRLDFGADIPDHSSFSKNRHGRFRQSGVFEFLVADLEPLHWKKVEAASSPWLLGELPANYDRALIPTCHKRLEQLWFRLEARSAKKQTRYRLPLDVFEVGICIAAVRAAMRTKGCSTLGSSIPNTPGTAPPGRASAAARKLPTSAAKAVPKRVVAQRRLLRIASSVCLVSQSAGSRVIPFSASGSGSVATHQAAFVPNAGHANGGGP